MPTLSGTKRIRVPAGTQHGTVQRLRGEGPPKPGSGGRGDIFYRLEVEMPRELSSEQRQALDAFAAAINDHNPRERPAARRVRAVREGWLTVAVRKATGRQGPQPADDRRRASTAGAACS